MDVVCANCKTKIKIPDEKLKKIPKGKTVAIPCPKCEGKVTVDPAKDAGAAGPSAAAKKPSPAGGAPTANEEDSLLSNPFAFLEEGAKTAMICEPVDTVRSKVRAMLKKMEYHLAEPQSPREALKQMRAHPFDVIVINEKFGTNDPEANHVLRYMEQLLMSVRRNMYVTLLTDRFKTMDNMMAFRKSVNLIFNVEDLEHLDKIFNKCFNENEQFYRIFKDSLARVAQ